MITELLTAVAEGAPDTTSRLGGIALALLGTGVVLIVLGILFLIRKILFVLFNVGLILFGAALLLAAIFGGPLGIYERIFAWIDEQGLERPNSEKQGDDAADRSRE